jgi:protein-S-isoprenylcysteine O-methyltransferase Ste14
MPSTNRNDVTLASAPTCPLSWGWYLKVLASAGLMVGLMVAAIPTMGDRAEIHGWFPSPRLSSFLLMTIGQVVALAGLCFYIGSYLSLRRQLKGTLNQPTRLVSSGYPWGRIRHPMYLADIVWLLGFSLMAGWPWSVGLWVAVVVGVWVQLHAEEEHMAKVFPEDHAEWKTRSGRLLPWVGW